jgi:Arc/MetJ family transcription regulator
MNLDRELVAEAADILGTRGATETVHAAMAEVISSARRRRRTSRERRDLTPQVIDEMRRPRSSR